MERLVKKKSLWQVVYCNSRTTCAIMFLVSNTMSVSHCIWHMSPYARGQLTDVTVLCCTSANLNSHLLNRAVSSSVTSLQVNLFSIFSNDTVSSTEDELHSQAIIKCEIRLCGKRCHKYFLRAIQHSPGSSEESCWEFKWIRVWCSGKSRVELRPNVQEQFYPRQAWIRRRIQSHLIITFASDLARNNEQKYVHQRDIWCLVLRKVAPMCAHLRLRGCCSESATCSVMCMQLHLICNALPKHNRPEAMAPTSVTSAAPQQVLWKCLRSACLFAAPSDSTLKPAHHSALHNITAKLLPFLCICRR